MHLECEFAHAIIQHCNLYPNHNAVGVLNSADGRKNCDKVLQELLKREMDDDTRNALSIFRRAVSETDIANIKDENAQLLQDQISIIKP